MSSTKRGGQRSEADAYGTPLWVPHRLLEQVDLTGGIWVDPCAGTGALIQSVSMIRRDIEWKTYELRPECEQILTDFDANPTICDFLDPEVKPGSCNVVFMNPPYRLAQQFIEKSLMFATDAVVVLLRLNYLGSNKRHHFMQTNCPDVYVLPNRPSFVRSQDGRPTTDSIEYAWMVWRPVPGAAGNSVGMLKILNITPKAERRI